MNTTGQIQIRVSVSDYLGDLLKSKAQRLGIPVTQLVKHLIIDEVKSEGYPVFQASAITEKAAKEAMEHINEAVDATDFFNKVPNES